MGRLIDEDDVLKAVDQRIEELQSHPEFRRKYVDIDLYGVKEYIRQIPDAQQWILCSERMPEKFTNVLITHRRGVSVAWHNGSYWERGAGTKHRPLETVTAWMPFPKPCREEGK